MPAPDMFSRRSVLACGLAALLAGCTPPGLPDPIVPTDQGMPAPKPKPSAVLTLGVNGPITGLNPYLIADYCQLTQITASLLWPSVCLTDLAGASQLNPDLIVSAEVTATDPFTVRYTLATDASWSDGTPITAEDFRYLRSELATGNGTVGAAPYRLIETIDSADAGKTVSVVFRSRYPHWQQLFCPLLPAHILKARPNGFYTPLHSGRPVSGGRFRLDAVEVATGHLSMRRNDKYWGAGPSTLDQVVLRVGAGSEHAAALARGDIHAVLADIPPSADADLVTAPMRIVPRAAVCTLVCTTSSGPLASVLVRQAVAAVLDRQVLATALAAGRPAAALPATSLVGLPVLAQPNAAPPPSSSPNANPAPPPSSSPRPDPAAAASLLDTAGYRSGAGIYRTDTTGRPLSLTLAFGQDRPEHAQLAQEIRQQLAEVGIELNLLRLPGVDVVNSAFASTEPGATAPRPIDLRLLDLPRSPSDIVTAASAYSCPDHTPGPAQQGWAGNLTRWCDAAVSTPLVAALGQDNAELSTPLRQVLHRYLAQIPLAQRTTVFAVPPPIAAMLTGVAAADLTATDTGSVLVDNQRVPLGWIWQSPLVAAGN